MRPSFRTGFSLCCALALITATAVQPGLAAGGQSDPFAGDKLLQRPVSVSAKGVPLRSVVKRLAAVTGIALSVSGRAGDERTIVFAREVPLHEVMGSLAELYRLQWSQEDGRKPTRYVLRKSTGSARQEAEARSRSFGLAYAKWAGQATDARNPDTPERSLRFRRPGHPPILLDAGIKETQARILPLAVAELPRLLREGVISQPLSMWPQGERERTLRAVQNWLDHRTAVLHQLTLPGAEEGIRMGAGVPEKNQRPPTAPSAAQSRVEMELQAKGDLSMAISIRTAGGQDYPLASGPSAVPGEAGLALYSGLPLRPAANGGGAGRTESVLPASFTRTLLPSEPQGEEATSLYGTLETLSRRNGVSIYADDYSSTWLMGNRRPGGGYALPGASTLAQALDHLCREGASARMPHSFWWHRGEAAFLRSRYWLWDAEAVLPADLAQSLASSLRGTGRPGAADLARIASLTGLQVASLQSRPHGLRAWKALVQVPNRLSLASRVRLAQRELTWDTLSDPDRMALLRMLPQLQTGEGPYSARITGRLEGSYGVNSTAVLDIEGRCGSEPLSANFRIPVPNLRDGIIVVRH